MLIINIHHFYILYVFMTKYDEVSSRKDNKTQIDTALNKMAFISN